MTMNVAVHLERTRCSDGGIQRNQNGQQRSRMFQFVTRIAVLVTDGHQGHLQRNCAFNLRKNVPFKFLSVSRRR